MGAADDGAKAGATAASVAGTVTSAIGVGASLAAGTAATAASATLGTAAAAFGISTAIGSAIPIPLLGTAIGAIVGAITAIGVWLAGIGRDSFHPDAPTAAGWLLIFEISPGMLFSGVDTIDTEGAHNQGNLIHPRTGNAEAYACRLVRYFRLVSGIIANPSGKMYNPNDTGESGSDANPYIESATPDPGEPLTDVRVTRAILDKVRAAGGDPTAKTILPQLKTATEAKAALNLLRGQMFAQSGVATWDEFKDHRAGIWRNVQHLRRLAGEKGPDPVLDALLGVTYHHAPAATHGAAHTVKGTSAATALTKTASRNPSPAASVAPAKTASPNPSPAASVAPPVEHGTPPDAAPLLVGLGAFAGFALLLHLLTNRGGR